MKIKHITIMMFAALASTAQGMNAVEFLEGKFGSVSVTSTNLGIKFKSSGLIIIPYKKRVFTYRSSEYMSEPLILTADKERLSITDNEGMSVDFTAVSFKNQLKGFRIVHRIHEFGRIAKTDVMYLALSDTPLDVGEEDFLEEIPITEKTSEELDVLMRQLYKARSAARQLKLAQEQAQASNEIASVSSPAQLQEPLLGEKTTPITQNPDTAMPEKITKNEPVQDDTTQDEAIVSVVSDTHSWFWLLMLPTAAGVWLVFRLRRKKAC